jgi:hypothetical protein
MHATAGHRDCTHGILRVVFFLLFSLVLAFVGRNFCCCSSLMAFRSTGLENSFIQRGACLKQSFSSTKSRVGFFFNNWSVEKIHQVPRPYEDHVSWRSVLQFCPGNLLDLLNWSVDEREFFPSFLGANSFFGGRQFCSQSPRTRSSGWRQCVGRSRSRSLRRWPAHLILRFICFNFCFPANFLFNWPSLVVSPRGLEHLLLAECRTNSKKRFLCITSYFVVHNGRWLRTWSNINCKIALVKFSSPMRCFHSDCSASVCLNGHR